MDDRKPHRQSIRLSNYDYTTPGAYFITICAYQRNSIFGRIADDITHLNQFGHIATDELQKTAELRPYIELDEYIVMPNHIHALIWIAYGLETCSSGTARRAPTGVYGKPVPGSLPSVIASYKSAVTKRINELRNSPGAPVWQRGYYEHVIRRDESLDQIRQYIVNNPLNWATDPENINQG